MGKTYKDYKYGDQYRAAKAKVEERKKARKFKKANKHIMLEMEKKNGNE